MPRLDQCGDGIVVKILKGHWFESHETMEVVAEND